MTTTVQTIQARNTAPRCSHYTRLLYYLCLLFPGVVSRFTDNALKTHPRFQEQFPEFPARRRQRRQFLGAARTASGTELIDIIVDGGSPGPPNGNQAGRSNGLRRIYGTEKGERGRRKRKTKRRFFSSHCFSSFFLSFFKLYSRPSSEFPSSHCARYSRGKQQDLDETKKQNKKKTFPRKAPRIPFSFGVPCDRSATSSREISSQDVAAKKNRNFFKKRTDKKRQLVSSSSVWE